MYLFRSPVWFAIGILALQTAPVKAQTCDPLETAKLLPTDGVVDGLFGWSVSLSGDRALIGASGDSANGELSGAAYIYRLDGGLWVEEAKLQPADGGIGDLFGVSVALDGTTAVIGARWDDDLGDNSGSAYVFQYDGADWVEQAKLLPTDGVSGAEFGYAIGVSGDDAVVGAHLDNEDGTDAGAAYVFHFDGAVWSEVTKLQAFDGAANAEFGGSVSISNDTILVGADRADHNGKDSGAAYLFDYDGAAWIAGGTLHPADPAVGDRFAFSVSIDENTAVIGSHFDDDNGDRSGSAYVFAYDGADWIEDAKVTASDGAAGDSYGIAVAVAGESILVGAHWDDDFGSSSGSAYLYYREGSEWVEQAKLLPSDPFVDDRFGAAVALSGDRAVIGAWAVDDNGDRSGAAYTFDLNCADADCLTLTVDNLIAGKRAVFTIVDGTPGAKGVTVYGTKPGQLTIKDYAGYCATFGIKGVSEDKVLGGLNRTFDGNGEISFTVPIPDNVSGLPLLFQSAERGTCPDECMSNLIDAVVQ